MRVTPRSCGFNTFDLLQTYAWSFLRCSYGPISLTNPFTHSNQRMKHLPVILLCIPFAVFGQDVSLYVLPAQGGFATSETMTLSWTLGEGFTETTYLDDVVVTQGFQQPFFDLQRVTPLSADTYQANIYPNPTPGNLNLELMNPGSGYQVEVIDLTGKVLQTLQATDKICQIDMSDYPAGQYFVRISSDTDLRQTLFNVVKH